MVRISAGAPHPHPNRKGTRSAQLPEGLPLVVGPHTGSAGLHFPTVPAEWTERLCPFAAEMGCEH